MTTRLFARPLSVILGMGGLVLALVLSSWTVSAGADEVADEPAGFVLVGTVTGTDGPLPGASVMLQGRMSSGWFPLGNQITGPGGGYEFSGLHGFVEALGITVVRVGFSAPGYAPEFHPDQPEFELAQDIPVLPSVTRIDAQLEGGPLHLAGRLTVGGEAVRSALVRVLRLDSANRWQDYSLLRTTPAGAWFAPVGAGRYRVELGDGRGEGGPILVRDEDGAEVLDVTTAPLDGLDLDLEGGVIQGRMTSAGAPLDATVSLYEARDYDGDRTCVYISAGYTDRSTGYYALIGVPEGRYYLRTEGVSPAGPLISEVYEDSQETCSAPSTEIPIGNKQNVLIDMDLDPYTPPPSPSVPLPTEPWPTGPTDPPWPTPSLPGETAVPTPPGPTPTFSPTPTYTPTPSVTPTATPTPVPADGPRPVVLGVPRVGGVLVGLSWPRPGSTATRQWLRDGAPVAGATGSLYLPRKADKGTTLAFRVTHSRNGEVTSVATSRGVRVR